MNNLLRVAFGGGTGLSGVAATSVPPAPSPPPPHTLSAGAEEGEGRGAGQMSEQKAKERQEDTPSCLRAPGFRGMEEGGRSIPS